MRGIHSVSHEYLCIELIDTGLTLIFTVGMEERDKSGPYDKLLSLQSGSG